ncbi:MAG: MFS transporter [Verrucomicrobia bacterium]|nr:MFS transporter [Verrucomicrobiota bacterium]
MIFKYEKHSLALLYFIYFCEYFVWGCTVTFASLFILGKIPLELRTSSLIWTLALFPVGGMIGAPLLGDLSDWIGRRKILLLSIVGSILCLIWAGISLYQGNYNSFILSEFFVGFFAGKLALIQASVAELQIGSKGRKFAFFSVLEGLPCVLGPFVGFYLYNREGIYFNPSFFGALFFTLAFFAALIYFHETYLPQDGSFSFKKYVSSFGHLFKLSWKEKVFPFFFMNLMGWYLVITFLSPFLLSHLQLQEGNIGIYNFYLGLAFTIGGVLGAKWIFSFWQPANVLRITLKILAIALFVLFATATPLTLWPLLSATGIAQALIYPAFMTLLSNQASPGNQGKLFGLVEMSNGICRFVSLGLILILPGSLALLFGAILVALCLFLFKKRLHT